MIIKYKSCTINGIDMTGKVEKVDDKQGARLIKSGFAELLDAPPKENYILHNPRLADYPAVEKPADEPKSGIFGKKKRKADCA